MKQILISLNVILLAIGTYADIAPNPIVVKGVYTSDSCKIQMISEYVYADLWNDSARIECTFKLVNFGDSATIQVGFPEMNFRYWSLGGYSYSDKRKFQIEVDDQILNRDQIRVPSQIDSLYTEFMAIDSIEDLRSQTYNRILHENNVSWSDWRKPKYPSRKVRKKVEHELDSLEHWYQHHENFDIWLDNTLRKYAGSGINPWYLWRVHFGKDETKTIKVIYSLPSGLGYGQEYRYFKYLMETGAGWYKEIQTAKIKLQLHDIGVETIEEISPTGFQVDTTAKTIEWELIQLEPRLEDNIYLRYFNPTERKDREEYQKRRNRKMRFRFLNPATWFR